MSSTPSSMMPYHALPAAKAENPPGRPSLEGETTATAEIDGAPLSTGPDGSSPSEMRSKQLPQSHEKLVFCDPVAFRYLEEDPTTVVLDRRRRLPGYELYIVEQWACSRVHPTFIICTYTGDMSHSILVNVLSVPVDKSTWSPRLKIYFQAVEQFHARERETPLGSLMVTNLSGFPSALTVISVPDGDVKRHREDFIVNENLKRMGCSGRAAMNLQPPQPSTIARFHHLYRTSESVPLYASVMELVRLCQTALILYGKLQPTYADGLLCDITEKAINDWWTDIGTFFHNVEPSDGILGPTTVAALLGLMLGAFNRLKAAGAPIGKDVLDMPSMKRALGHFQKSQRIERTRRLDRATLDRLQKATDKTARGEGWTVPKAVKSTVAELSGKGGEMVMGIVGARDKVGIAEVETLDVERFAQLVSGERMKWLWQGKNIKSYDGFGATTDELNGRIFSTDDQGNFMWTSSKKESITEGRYQGLDPLYAEHSVEGRSGFGRLRDAVGIGGLRHHTSRKEADDQHERATLPEAPTSSRNSHDQDRVPDHKMQQRIRTFVGTTSTMPPHSQALAEAPAMSEATARARQRQVKQRQKSPEVPPNGQSRPKLSLRRTQIRDEVSRLRDELQGDVYQDFSSDFEYQGPRSKALRRSQSAVRIDPWPAANSARSHHIHRHLSFSLVEETVLNFAGIVQDGGPQSSEQEPLAAMAALEATSLVAQRQTRRIFNMQETLIPFTETQVSQVEILDRDGQDHLDELNNLYYQRLEDYQTLQATSTDLVAQEKSGLTESLRRMEMLGQKIDYELTALHSRMQEVEVGVKDFERSVDAIEGRVKELVGVDGYTQVPWYQKLMTFWSSRSVSTNAKA